MRGVADDVKGVVLVMMSSEWCLLMLSSEWCCL